jgi:penicillin amidase
MPFRPRHAVALVVLAAACWVGARRIGPAPALGPFLDPAHGVWSMSRSASMPASADARIPGLSAAVKVVYDDRAVPHIFATTEADAYRALGYVVARDRLFQMYLQTLAAAGRLTEIAGPRALPLDREMRGLGLTAVARQLADGARGGPEFTAAAAAYADGVNAFIESMPASALPIEFRLTGTRPERWDVVSSYLLLGRMGWTLAYGDAEGDRYAAASRVGMAAASALFPNVAPIQEPIQPNGTGAPRFETRPLPPPGAPEPAANLLAAARDAFLPSGAHQRAADAGEATVFASNNWAVSPRRSANGHALLAGDPHLDLTLPSIWYEAHLVVPGTLDVYGVTIPGAPFIVIGFNRDVAWTMTNTGTDVLDFFTEQVDDTLHPARHLVDGSWRTVTPRVETYRDGSGSVVASDTMYSTYRGPLKRIGGRWISMRWTVLEGGTEPAALLGVQRATSVSELQARIGRDYTAPAQNFLAADRGGHIALRSTGRFPIRAGNGAGDTIRDGGTAGNDWRGNVPLAAYPQSFDPPQGFVASANQQPIDPSTSAYWWGGSFDPWRALRINQILRADSSVTVDEMRAFQTDPASARADLFVARILAAGRNVLRRRGAGTDSAKLARATALLAEWDRRYTKENRRAVLFEETMLDVVAGTWDELLAGNGSRARRVATPPSAVLLQLMSDSASVWWDDRRTPERETRDDVLAQALVTALDRVVAKRGDPGSDEWRWDHARFANVNHLLRLPALSALNVPVQGGPGTLAPSSGTGTHGPSWRMVVDLGPRIQAWTTYPGGQSGNPLSTRYRDRMDMWSRGELEAARFPRTADELTAGQTMSTLTLTGRR